MICEPHGMMNDDGKCPYCRIAELEAQLASAELKAFAQEKPRWITT